MGLSFRARSAEIIAPKLRDLEAAGDIAIVDQIGDDIEELVSIVERIDRAHLLPDENAMGVDPIGIGQVLDALATRGIDNNTKKRTWVSLRDGS